MPIGHALAHVQVLFSIVFPLAAENLPRPVLIHRFSQVSARGLREHLVQHHENGFPKNVFS